MNLLKQKNELTKIFSKKTPPKDFIFNAFSFLLLCLFLGAGIGLQYFYEEPLVMEKLMGVVGYVLFSGVIMAVFPYWTVSIIFLIVTAAGMLSGAEGNIYPVGISLLLGFLIAPALQLVQHWDKVIVLRFGKFKKVRGSGLFFLMPIMDRIAAFIDTRIRATDFRAEKTLTTDTVPVSVDALAFWMVWDASKTVLEVENYFEAVVLSAQTALREAIGKHELADLLSSRDKLCKEIQLALDAKTNPWGITILSVEITDIIIPKELEHAMSRRAQAERERQSRIILGEAEIEVAEKFEKASLKYRENPTALQLRAMNMVYEGLKNNNSIMLIPSSALDSMSLGAMLGATAYGKMASPDHTEKKEENHDKD
ncbi:MAG: slipin family protein [Spirochaetales bacterium]|nr:slipin family protein [Spirochaetales bacterium]